MAAIGDWIPEKSSLSLKSCSDGRVGGAGMSFPVTAELNGNFIGGLREIYDFGIVSVKKRFKSKH